MRSTANSMCIGVSVVLLREVRYLRMSGWEKRIWSKQEEKQKDDKMGSIGTNGDFGIIICIGGYDHG